ncbi:sortase [Pseudalkalibacillus hwajinpoensis]|uniref:class F sortase n=1 Tax=Guptibacillus hwajinpoensis TaxID=208199 RepID=UPI00325B7241
MRKVMLLIVGVIIWLVLAGYNNNFAADPAVPADEPVESQTQLELEPEKELEEVKKPDTLSDEIDAQKDKIKAAKDAEKDTEEGIVPVKIDIPAIDVSANIENVGVLENGQMGVPSNIDDVGWFEPGYKPGTTGNAVLAGHVDSKTGPAIFFYLDQLSEGNEIILTDKDGKTLTFVVKGMKAILIQTPQSRKFSDQLTQRT